MAQESQAFASQFDFAKEVQTDRLSLLWRVTLAVVFVLFTFLLLLTTLQTSRASDWSFLIAMALVGAGCLLTGQQLRRGHYTIAAWAYAGGFILAIALLMYGPPNFMRNILPFSMPLLMFVVGLLLPPRMLGVLLMVAVVIVLGVPWLYDATVAQDLSELHMRYSSGGYQAAALLFTILAGLLTAQVSGELYAIGEWALSHYRRERERKLELQESQITLQKTLARANVLAENLEEANTDLAETNEKLEIARYTAEEAKNFRGRFLANMSHELRTPLNAVIGFSDTMLNFPEMYGKVSLPDEYRLDMEQVYTSGKQLLHVINDILDLSRVDAGKLELQLREVDLTPIFKATMVVATGLVGEKPISLLRYIAPHLPLVWADADRVRQVLLNLISNAAKFTEEGHITLGATIQDDEVVVSIGDTGCGILPEDREIIFEEFKQGHAGVQSGHAGSGLGLTISRNLLSLMGGRIWFESVADVGTTFYFTLPIVPVASPSSEDEAVSVVALPLGVPAR